MGPPGHSTPPIPKGCQAQQELEDKPHPQEEEDGHPPDEGKKKIATFKLPERVEVVEALPMTPSGKTRKNVLREEITSKLRAEGAT